MRSGTSGVRHVGEMGAVGEKQITYEREDAEGTLAAEGLARVHGDGEHRVRSARARVERRRRERAVAAAV